MTESVWDYPRPPRVEPANRRIRVELGGETIVDTLRAHRVLETTHPPVYYVPPEDIASGVLVASGDRTTFCEWKGVASYYDVVAGGKRAKRAAWTYSDPTRGFEVIRDAVAFYPSAMDACLVDYERVEPQPGGFYGGWITADIIGPFKGDTGTVRLVGKVLGRR
jgi:uncharacterized protein (DUF427 family)